MYTLTRSLALSPGRGLPEIVDFGVLEKYRRRGIGNALMDAAEDIAKEYADTVYLGVGLHSGYGSAQRMYVKRGYIPDGSGVWYKDRPAEPCGVYPNDDELVSVYLRRKLCLMFCYLKGLEQNGALPDEDCVPP